MAYHLSRKKRNAVEGHGQRLHRAGNHPPGAALLQSTLGLLCSAALLLTGCAADPGVPVAPGSAPPGSAPAVSQATPAQELDLQVVPGDRVGPVTANTNRQDLVTLFGAAQLRDQDVEIGEGMTEPGTVVNLGGDRNFTIIWTDASRSKIAVVRDFGAAWKTPQGIGLGSSFAELQQVLGEFQLYGFAWDYGGTLSLENSKLSQYDGLLILRVAPPAAVSPDSAAYQAVLGDTLYPSSDPNFQTLNLSVNEMMVYLTRPEV